MLVVVVVLVDAVVVVEMGIGGAHKSKYQVRFGRLRVEQ